MTQKDWDEAGMIGMIKNESKSIYTKSESLLPKTSDMPSKFKALNS